MRVVLAAFVLFAAGCGRSSEPTSAQDTMQREQARFDAERRPDMVIEALAIKPGSRVADIGANTGKLTVHIARAVKPNGVVVATDVDSAVFETLHARLAAGGVSDIVDTRVVAPDQPGLEPGIYDAILVAEVDQLLCMKQPCSVDDVARWLASAARALKPGGRIVINNKVELRGRSVQSAEQAGLVLEHESTPVPSHFLATFVRPKPK